LLGVLGKQHRCPQKRAQRLWHRGRDCQTRLDHFPQVSSETRPSQSSSRLYSQAQPQCLVRRRCPPPTHLLNRPEKVVQVSAKPWRCLLPLAERLGLSRKPQQQPGTPAHGSRRSHLSTSARLPSAPRGPACRGAGPSTPETGTTFLGELAASTCKINPASTQLFRSRLGTVSSNTQGNQTPSESPRGCSSLWSSFRRCRFANIN